MTPDILGVKFSIDSLLRLIPVNIIGVFKADINFHSEVKAVISIKIDKIQSK